LFTARPRIGWAQDNWLFYGTGGLALTQVSTVFQFSDTFASAAERVKTSSTEVGWTAGGGLEIGLTPSWTLKLEYLHIDFGQVAQATGLLSCCAPVFTFPTNPFTHRAWLKDDLGRVGVNFRF
jgi:outer membrane immunogenic protein